MKLLPILLLTQVMFYTAAIRPIAIIIGHQKLIQTVFEQFSADFHPNTKKLHVAVSFFSFSFYMNRAPANCNVSLTCLPNKLIQSKKNLPIILGRQAHSKQMANQQSTYD